MTLGEVSFYRLLIQCSLYSQIMFSMSLSFLLQRLQNMVARIAGHAFMLYYQSLMDTIIAP